MNVLVMAAGSVGGYFGGLLAKAGNDVLFIARGRTCPRYEIEVWSSKVRRPETLRSKPRQ